MFDPDPKEKKTSPQNLTQAELIFSKQDRQMQVAMYLKKVQEWYLSLVFLKSSL